MQIHCPHCQNPIELAEGHAEQILCSACGGRFQREEERTPPFKGDYVNAPHAAANQPGRAGPDAPGATEAYESHSAPAEAVGWVIAGKYKLLQLIGEGGMGAVYMADQIHPLKRRVAVKVIKAGMDSARELARFEALGYDSDRRELGHKLQGRWPA